jgi:hypothetical protein
MPITARPIDDDDEVIADRGKVSVPLTMMDGRNDQQHFAISDSDVQRVLDARASYKDRISFGMRRHRVKTETRDADPRLAAYNAMKARLTLRKVKS